MMRRKSAGARWLGMIALALGAWGASPGWCEEAPRVHGEGDQVQERGIIPPAIKGLTPAELLPGQELKDMTILRGFKRYWIDRLELTPPEFSMGQTLERTRVWYHCQSACLNVDRVSGVALEIHHRRGPGPRLLIAVVQSIVLSPGGGGCPPGSAIPNAGCVTLSIARTFQTAPGVFEVTLLKETDRINRIFPIVPVGEDGRFRAGGQ
jgi:hypothetical protein